MILNVVNFLDENRFEAWEVRRTINDCNSMVFRTDDGLTFEENKQRYSRWEENAEGRFFLIGKQKKNDTKGQFTDEFSIHHTEAVQQPSNYAPTISGIPEGYVSAKEMELMLKEQQNRFEMEQLKAEMKELKKNGGESKTDKFIGMIQPLMPAIISGLFPKAAGMITPSQVAIAGMGDERMDMLDDHEDDDRDCIDLHGLSMAESDKLLAIGARLKEQEPEEWLGMLDKIAGMAEAKDNMYNMAKGFLTQK